MKKQVCRNLTDTEDRFLKDSRHLIVDRDTSIIAMRRFPAQNTETRVVLLLPKRPNLNACMKRGGRSLKLECPDRMIFFGRKSIENSVREYSWHYHAERKHQSLGNEFIEPDQNDGSVAVKIEYRERLRDMLMYHYRRAA